MVSGTALYVATRSSSITPDQLRPKHVENRFSGEVRFVDGMPQTSKEDRLNHGFGTKSMAMVVERHGGTLTMEAQGDLFCLDALIPVPK